jgi:chemotaxis protein MotA
MKKRRFQPDWGLLLGLLVALLSIFGGLVLEGGVVRDVLQPTAALIVLGGTIGAVLVSTPRDVLTQTVKMLANALVRSRESSFYDANTLTEQLVSLSNKSRRGGLVGLEPDIDRESDPYLKKCLTLAVDGASASDTKRIMELDLDVWEQEQEKRVRVLENAGGYCPTIGIIGAVLGLIQVMKKLDDIQEVGHGIAVAFVATIYGVAFANLLFLPLANKLKAQVQQELQRREMLLEGTISIIEGLNPQLLRLKLSAFIQEDKKSQSRLFSRASSGPADPPASDSKSRGKGVRAA